MVYSNARYDGDNPGLFPPPAVWLVWSDDGFVSHDYKDYRGTLRHQVGELKGSGSVRHQESLYKAITYIKRYATGHRASDGVIIRPWRVYEWVGDRYVLRYSGEAGEKVKDIPIFKRGAVKNRSLPVQDVTDSDLDEVMASLGIDRG